MKISIIKRTQYLDQLIPLIGSPDIKIISGVRRSGKSTILKHLIEYILSMDSRANIIFIDFNNLDFEPYKDYLSLRSFIDTKIVKKVKNYLIIDEIQECSGFEKTINHYHNLNLIDIFITGSNAFLLSSDLATLFTGRYIETMVYPFSYKEFALYQGKPTSNNALFEEYVKWGGMPGALIYQDSESKNNYLKGVYKTITHRDLVFRYHIKDLDLLDRITFFLLDNIGHITNPYRLANSLTSLGKKANPVTTAQYLGYLSSAYLFESLRRYDLKGKAYLESSNKYYLIDHGFRQAILGKNKFDYGRILENVVCVELLRRGYEVNIGKWYEYEIDFVVSKASKTMFIQVAADISFEETLARELSPLKRIKSNYPKILIARTNQSTYYHDGIEIIDIAEWLLRENI